MSLPVSFLDELRARTSLSGLIGKTTKLTKAGTEQRGCCPFHNEKTPSFYVNDAKGFYHCFGCSAHGDAIRWMTEQRGLPFMDAVKELAAAAGMEMPAREPGQDKRDREHEELFEIMSRASGYFKNMLWSMSPAAERAAAYVEQRGMKDMCRPFSIGFAHAGLREHLRDVAEEKLIACGLLRKRDSGEIGEFFRNRIMFPIRDQRGRVIGFGGRVLGDQQPKYLNTPETPIFDKGRTLFNIDRGAPAARAAKRLLVVEGYMDVIGLATAGIDEVVAPNGTALTEAQIDRLWRVCETPILCFDGDKAGKAAAARAAIRALPLLKPDHSLSFVTPPEGQDPDDVARGGGREAVETMLTKTRPLVEVLFEHEAAAGPLDTPEQRAGLEKRLRDHAASINDRSIARAYLEDFRDRYAARMARAIGPRRAPMQANPSTERQPFIRREKPQTAASKAIGRGSLAENVERAVLAGLLRFPEVATDSMEAVVLSRFTNDNLRALRDAMLDMTGDPRGFTVPDELAAAAEYARTGPLKFSFTTGNDAAIAKVDLVDALIQLRR